MKKMDLQERVNGFSFDYNIIDINIDICNILDIHRYLMKEI